MTIAKPVRLNIDLNDAYAVFRIYDANEKLLLNLLDCERYQSVEQLAKVKAIGEEIVSAINGEDIP